ERVQQYRADQVLLGFEMRVEGAVGQACRIHDSGEAHRGNPAFAKLRRGHIDDVLARGFLVSLFVAHSLLLRTAILSQGRCPRKPVIPPYCIMVIIMHYNRNSMEIRPDGTRSGRTGQIMALEEATAPPAAVDAERTPAGEAPPRPAPAAARTRAE